MFQWCRNKIINGDFSVWNHGATFTAAVSSSRTADMWDTNHTSDAVVDILRTADSPTAAEAGAYTPYCLHATLRLPMQQ